MSLKWYGLVAIMVLGLFIVNSDAQTAIVDVCPANPVQSRPPTFEPGGIILTSFDKADLWVYDIDRNTRYPLPETSPCTSNCHLSPDATWIIFLDPQTFAFSKMRLNGTQRTQLVQDASEVRWWNRDTLAIWTTDQTVYLRPEAGLTAEPTFLHSAGVVSVQPNGYNGLQITGENGTFSRSIVSLDGTSDLALQLAGDKTYFNASAWSPDGQSLAYVGTGRFDETTGIAGAELFLASVSNGTTQQVTAFMDTYGAVRINGYAPADLSWSPDNRYLVFWVIELTGSNPGVDTGEAVLHVLDVQSGEIRRYCGFTTIEHTPETPRLVWSPDRTHVAFAANVAGDDKGALLLALNIETGTFTELSNGMFPVFGIPQLNAWGVVP